MKPLLYGLLAVLLMGCAARPPLPERPPAETISVFAFHGRLAVQQGETRHYVNIDWRHDASRDEIFLTSPLGQGVAEIVRDASGARLLLADQRRFVADDWNDLAVRMFGFPLPLGASVRWLLGDQADAGDWRIRIAERESEAPGALPALIELERDDVHVRLKIDEWTEAK